MRPSGSQGLLVVSLESFARYHGIPLVEVIYPAVRRAVRATRNDRVGVIGTRATITSRAYDDAFAAATHLRIQSAACPRFVEFVDEIPKSASGKILRRLRRDQS